MVAGEIAATVVFCITASIAVILRKSKCFLRESEGNVSWGIGYTDLPIVPKTSHEEKDDETPVCDTPSSEYRDGGSIFTCLEQLANGISNWKRNLPSGQGGSTVPRPRSSRNRMILGGRFSRLRK